MARPSWRVERASTTDRLRAIEGVEVHRLFPFADGPPAASVPSVLLVEALDARIGPKELRAAARELTARCEVPFASRAYCFPLALVATHQLRVGTDIERVDRLTAFDAPAILSPAERARYLELTDEQVGAIWSGKEALAKALGDALDYEPRRLESPWFWREGRSGRFSAKSFSVNATCCAWVVWERPAGAGEGAAP
jgi:hypothetical protein